MPLLRNLSSTFYSQVSRARVRQTGVGVLNAVFPIPNSAMRVWLLSEGDCYPPLPGSGLCHPQSRGGDL